ncbi:MAG: hypothetical protein NZN45_00660, partial [Rhodovarius sp.]|nr:hypothetical protein [Rhodovarius sp.]
MRLSPLAGLSHIAEAEGFGTRAEGAMADRAAWLAALKLQLDWGVDEALVEHPPGLAAPERRADAPRPARPQAAAAGVGAGPAQPAAARPIPPALQEAATLAAACRSLEELRQAMAEFAATPLRETATQLVFADGVPGAPV